MSGLCETVEPMPNSEQTKDWETISQSLRHPIDHIEFDPFDPNYLDIPIEMLKTMDACSKCWSVIQQDNPDLLLQEIDGGSWFFCEPCVAEIPLPLQKILYFFHTMQTSVKNFKNYAVPTKHVGLRYKRGDKKTISEMIWNKEESQHIPGGDTTPSDDSQHSPSGAPSDEYINLNKTTQTRRLGSHVKPVKILPFKIRLGFTGALFKYKDKQQRKLIAVLSITWARNWDMLGYIKHEFLADIEKKIPGMKSRADEIQTLKHIWRSMLDTGAFKYLGLDAQTFGAPLDYMDDRGGCLGVDWLFNMFQIPYHVLGIIKHDILTKERRQIPAIKLSDITIDDLRIIGMPQIPFERHDTEVDAFITYMGEYVDGLNNEYEELLKRIRKFYTPKPKRKDEEEIQEDDGGFAGDPSSPDAVLKCLGAWPLRDSENGYVKFGMPPIPIWLSFCPGMDPSYNSTFDTWLVEIGGANGLPETVKACLRSFWVQELKASRDHIYATWRMFLNDNRDANPELVYSTYYGENADPLASLAMAGYLRPWWVGVVGDIKGQRDQEVDVRDVSQSLSRYLTSSILYHKSAIFSGVFRSTRVTQALQIVERCDFQRVCVHDPSSIQEYMKKIVRKNVVFDPYRQANESFWRGFEVLNESFRMNSSNLEFMVEIMISQIMWMLGPENETFVGYFQGIIQLAGNGHFSLTTKEGTFPDKRKPNSTGADFTREKLTELFQMLLDRVGIRNKRENLQAPTNCMGWTMASIPLATHATVTDGRIESLPDKKLVLKDIVAMEMRGKGECNQNTLIKFAIPRNANGQDQMALNTCDPDHSNVRKQQYKRKITDLQICAMASNVPDQNAEDAEMSKTMNAVLHAMVPGSGPYVSKKQKTSLFVDTCDEFGGRNFNAKNMDGIINLLPFSHVWACCFPALMNKMGMIPFEINAVSLAFLDWIFLAIKDNTRGILNKSVTDSFQRMRSGYEARQVAKSLWIKSIMYLGCSEDEDQALERTLVSMYTNAIPVQDVVCAAHCFLTRGIHMGCLLMISCIARHLEVPIVTVDQLKIFFDEDQMMEYLHSEWVDQHSAFNTKINHLDNRISKIERSVTKVAQLNDDTNARTRLTQIENNQNKMGNALRSFIEGARIGSKILEEYVPEYRFNTNGDRFVAENKLRNRRQHRKVAEC